MSESGQEKTGIEKAREISNQLKADVNKVKVNTEVEMKEAEKTIAELPKDFLQTVSGVGMRNVDPMDIRPPMCLLVQKISDTSQMIGEGNVKPEPGQFFHTGKNEIYSFVECAIVYAAKSKYVDKNHPEKGQQDQYKAIAVSLDDLKVFGLIFRSSAQYALSPLFSKAASMNRPMFSFVIRIDSKKLVNAKNQEYFVPVVKVDQALSDQLMLQELYKIAKKFDREVKPTEIEDEEEEVIIPSIEAKEDLPF